MTGPGIGDRVSEYILTDLLGAGSFGRVYKAVHHIWKDRVVAIKVPTHPEYVSSLRHEGVALHGLSHPNIVRAIGLDPFADPPYFIMDYVDGCSLRDVIRRHDRGLPVTAIRGVLVGLLSGLAHAHARGVVHRDIKPENVLIDRGGDGSLDHIEPQDVRISDFGLGRALHLTTQSILQSGSMPAEPGKSISGTLAYMSPEQREAGDDDPRHDLYSVGVVLFEIATGERPSGTETPGMVRDGLPAWIDEVYTRLYARLDRRFADANEALAAVEQLSAPPAIGGVPPRVASPPPAECPTCRGAVDPGDNFCMHCGCQLVREPTRCPQCRGWAQPQDRYCIFCGAPIETVVS